MGKKLDPADFRNKRSTDLLLLERALQSYAGAIDTGPLIQAAYECKGSRSDRKATAWGYSLNNMLFRIKKPRKSRPTNAPDSLDLELCIDISGDCNCPTGDPFHKLAVDIEISCFNSSTTRKSVSAWHFDRHIQEEEDNESEEVHPLYHAHHGGRRMHSLEDYGDLLLLSAPRLQHPPMDAVLAIDFVLSNFLPEIWRNLRNNETLYQKVVKNSQAMCLEPYLKTLAGTIDQGNTICPSKLNPNLIIH